MAKATKATKVAKVFRVGDIWATGLDDDDEFIARITDVWTKDENETCGRCEMYCMDDIEMKDSKGGTRFSEDWMRTQISKEFTPEYWL